MGSKAHSKTTRSAWFGISVALMIISIISLGALIGFGLWKPWVMTRFGGNLTPLGAIIAATIVSASGAWVHDRQTEAAFEKTLRDHEGDLWKRFDQAVKQFGETHYAVRIAAVYALFGLGDDWVRYHREDRGETRPERIRAQIETLCDLVSAELRLRNQQSRVPNVALQPKQVVEAEAVNEAIIGQFAVRFGPEEQANVSWRNLGVKLDLRGSDLSKCLWSKVDLRDAVLADCDLTDIDLSWSNLAGANFKDATLDRADLREAKNAYTANAKSVIGIQKGAIPLAGTPTQPPHRLARLLGRA